MNCVFDAHTHILPCMDDGSRSAGESIEMLCEQARQGVELVATTPHFYPEREYPERFLQRRETAKALLEAEIKKYMQDCSSQQIKLPAFITGAEVAFYDGISRSENLEQLCYSGTDMILIEMPCREWSKSVVHEVLNIPYTLELRPVIAHIDRYYMFHNKSALKELVREGVIIQSNASFFADRTTSKKALRMLDKGYIHLLGSDCHNLTSRCPNIAQAREVISDSFGEEYLYQMDVFAGELFGASR